MSSAKSDKTGIQEDWELLVSFLPDNWQDLAAETGALKGLRKNKSAENLLRVLLLHLGCGHSLLETAVRARQEGLAELSSVALWNRLRKSQAWLRSLCLELFRERGVELSEAGGLQVRALDATTVKEPGKTGSLWRVHYSVRLPSLACDFFRLTATKGTGTGESFMQFPIKDGDYLLADRGYSTARGLRHVVQAGGVVTVRVNTRSLVLETAEGQPFDLLAAGGDSAACRQDRFLGSPGGGCGWRGSDGAGLHAPQDPGGDPDRPQEPAPEGFEKRQAAAAGNARVRQVRDCVHDLPGDRVQRCGRARVVPYAVAGRIGVQALQVAGRTGSSPQARRAQRQGLAVREAVRGPAGGKTHRPRSRHFPLGIPLGAGDGLRALGATSSSC